MSRKEIRKESEARCYHHKSLANIHQVFPVIALVPKQLNRAVK